MECHHIFLHKDVAVSGWNHFLSIVNIDGLLHRAYLLSSVDVSLCYEGLHGVGSGGALFRFH